MSLYFTSVNANKKLELKRGPYGFSMLKFTLDYIQCDDKIDQSNRFKKLHKFLSEKWK